MDTPPVPALGFSSLVPVQDVSTILTNNIALGRSRDTHKGNMSIYHSSFMGAAACYLTQDQMLACIGLAELSAKIRVVNG